MEFEKKPMVNWYDPKQLASTGLKTVVSGIFGSFADNREMQAALDTETRFYDFSQKEAIWLDFISDLGDGFNPTYTMAKLMSQDYLEVAGNKLNRGDILIMGGDEIYPTPEMHEYRNRLQGPYHAAFPGNKNDPSPPSLFAIPGNHDWYDGLSNFLKIFCQKRALGNWRTQQSRSYFAIKLPHNYWLLAVDIQLEADIDYPQINYFRHIAENEIQSGDKIILATAEPSWVYQSFDKKNSSHKRLKFFKDNVLCGKADGYYGGKNENLEITTILTGDLHHYARYEEVGEQNKICQMITAGGGGAFMHPTHTLKDKIEPREGYNASLKKVFPSKGESKRLSLLNIIFPAYSLTMLLFFGVLHTFTTWLLQVGTKVNEKTFMESAATIDLFNGGIGDYIDLIISSINHIPSVVGLNLLLVGGILIFTDTKSGKGNYNYIAGFLHGLLHLINLYFCIWLFSWFNLAELGLALDHWKQVLLFSAEMIVIGGIFSGILFGIYLLLSVSFLDNHITEASSSYRWEGYKNFLRIHVSEKGITIYPIGVKNVVKNWKNVGSKEKPKFKGDTIDYQLIENPIEINNEKTL
ncbi:MAG: metallophosphoesterase [Cyclobacteriaceae bacterium]